MTAFVLLLTDFFAAHKVPDRAAHETDRGWQRVLFAVLPLAIAAVAGRTGMTLPAHDETFALVCAGYAVVASAYLTLIRFKPLAGARLQYAFMLADPLFVVSAVVTDPALFGWYSVLLMVIAARVGVRYGVRSFYLQWGACAFWSALFAFQSGIVLSRGPAIALLAATILLGTPLFVPLIRIQERTRLLERQRARSDAVSSAVAERGEFLSQVSLELRAPLQSILTALDAFEVRHPAQADVDLISRVRRAANRLNMHLADVIILARSESRTLVLQPRKVDVGSLVLERLDAATEGAAVRGLRLRVDLPAELTAVFVDGNHLGRIIDNLLANAIRSTQTGTVTVTLHPFNVAKRRLAFEVSDTGPGISEPDLQRLFDSRKAAGSAYVGEGIGIGLASVGTLVKHLGGRVEVTSGAKTGTTFRVEVDAAPAGQKVVEGASVLVIDDDKEALERLGGTVGELGLRADLALGPADGCNLLAARAYAIVLVSVDMELTGGAEVARWARTAASASASAQWIATTTAEVDSAKPIHGFDAVVQVPVSARSLKRLVVSRDLTAEST